MLDYRACLLRSRSRSVPRQAACPGRVDLDHMNKIFECFLLPKLLRVTDHADSRVFEQVMMLLF